jgi:hypothetical protein
MHRFGMHGSTRICRRQSRYSAIQPSLGHHAVPPSTARSADCGGPAHAQIAHIQSIPPSTGTPRLTSSLAISLRDAGFIVAMVRLNPSGSRCQPSGHFRRAPLPPGSSPKHSSGVLHNAVHLHIARVPLSILRSFKPLTKRRHAAVLHLRTRLPGRSAEAARGAAGSPGDGC